MFTSRGRHGIVVGKSVSTNLLSFTSDVTSGLHSAAQTDDVFLDLANAIYNVLHNALLGKLHNYSY